MELRHLSITIQRVVCIAGVLLLALAAQAQDRIRVSDSEGKKSIASRVEPAYPPMARQMKIAGHVEVDVDIDAEGRVEKVDVVNGNALLGSACVAAVRQWKFTPFSSGGKPVPAVMRVGFNFSL